MEPNTIIEESPFGAPPIFWVARHICSISVFPCPLSFASAPAPGTYDTLWECKQVPVLFLFAPFESRRERGSLHGEKKRRGFLREACRLDMSCFIAWAGRTGTLPSFAEGSRKPPAEGRRAVSAGWWVHGAPSRHAASSFAAPWLAEAKLCNTCAGGKCAEGDATHGAERSAKQV